jgi:hypothetical protein
MYRIIVILALALAAGCQSAGNVAGCFDRGHITLIDGDMITFCTEARLETGAALDISVRRSGYGRGYRQALRKKIGTASVVVRSPDGIVQARITSGFAMEGAHAGVP